YVRRIFLEILRQVRSEQIDRSHGKSGTEYEIVGDLIRCAQARLEVLVVGPVQPSGRMRNRPEHASKRICCGWIELALLAVFRLEGRFVGPAEAEVQSQPAVHGPVILEEKSMAPP